MHALSPLLTSIRPLRIFVGAGRPTERRERNAHSYIMCSALLCWSGYYQSLKGKGDDELNAREWMQIQFHEAAEQKYNLGKRESYSTLASSIGQDASRSDEWISTYACYKSKLSSHIATRVLHVMVEVCTHVHVCSGISHIHGYLYTVCHTNPHMEFKHN